MAKYDSTAALERIRGILAVMDENTDGATSMQTNESNWNAVKYFSTGGFARDAAKLADEIITLDKYLCTADSFLPDQWVELIDDPTAKFKL